MQREKAKRFLAGALLTLMEQKPYEKINISEICAAAFLSRTSFYKYFPSKDELLRYQFRTMLAPEQACFGDDAVLCLTESLLRLPAYTRIVSEQRLLAQLLPELSRLFAPESSGADGLRQACAAYLSLLYAVRSAPRQRADTIVRWWHDAYDRAPELIGTRPERPASAPRERNAALLTGALRMCLEADTPLAQIHVKDLTALAGVNRSSFYRCFSTPEELFLYCLRERIAGDITGGAQSDRAVLEHYRGDRVLMRAAWSELGIEGFAALYTSVLNQLTDLPNDDVPGDQLYVYRLRNVCFVARRTALLYCFL